MLEAGLWNTTDKGFFLDIKESHIFSSSNGAYLLRLSAIWRSSKKWRHDRMDRDGLTSQRQTAQMERNESGECGMAEKNHRVSEA